jgi:hypothetical protein
MGYVGVPPQSGFITTAKQRITSSTNNYVDLDHSISSLADVIVWVNFVKQDSTNLSLTTSTRITLGGTLVSSDIVEIAYLGKAVSTQSPGTGTVTNDMLAGSIANSKLANSSITLNGSAVSLGGSATVSGGDNTPYFLAYRSGNQTGFSGNTWNEIVCNGEDVDSASAYDTSTGRFTPQTAGYYHIQFVALARDFGGSSTQSLQQVMYGIKKNNTGDPITINYIDLSTDELTRFSSTVSTIVYLNGSSDFVSPFCYVVGNSFSIHGERQYTNFSGYKLIT